MKLKKYCPYCGCPLTDRFTDGRTRRFCLNCRGPVYENPVPATCIVLVDDNDRILLVKRSVDPKRGQWCLPGGFMELDEAPESAALRELKEETGLTGRIERLLGVMSTPNADYRTILMLGFLVTQYAGTPSAGDDAADVAFFTLHDLPRIAFNSHIRFIDTHFG